MQTRTRRPGSRLLLAAALVAGIAAALFLGASIPEMAAGAAGIASRTVRLGLKIIGVIVALPVIFYLVERWFLSRSRRRDD
ncbi:MAG: hypothetical protein HY896_11105 [Deltaproteobacteria bacterium]|nr:hypothetical protein [Deltaproteobacteria bacterium]